MYLGRVRGSVVLGKTLPAIIGKKLRVVEEIVLDPQMLLVDGRHEGLFIQVIRR